MEARTGLFPVTLTGENKATVIPAVQAIPGKSFPKCFRAETMANASDIAGLLTVLIFSKFALIGILFVF